VKKIRIFVCLALVVSLLLVPQAYGIIHTLGYTELPAGGVGIRDSIKGCRFSMNETGQAENMTFGLYLPSGCLAKTAIYYTDNLTLLAETTERELSSNAGYEWFTFDFPSSKPILYPDTNYTLCVWANNSASANFVCVNYTAETNQELSKSSTYGTWPNPITYPSYATAKLGAYINYTVLNPPTIGDFNSSSVAVEPGDSIRLNVTVNDGDGIADLQNCTLAVGSAFSLFWLNSTNTFSELSDANNYCTFTSGERTTLNASAYMLSWLISLSQNFTVGQIGASGTVYDSLGIVASNSDSDVFTFSSLSLGEFSSTETAIATNETTVLNMTIYNPAGYSDFLNASLMINGTVSLAWLNSTGAFSIDSDANNYCTLHNGFKTTLNATSLQLSWNVSFAENYTRGAYVMALGTSSNVVGSEGSYIYGSGTTNLFTFTPTGFGLSTLGASTTSAIGSGIRMSIETISAYGRGDSVTVALYSSYNHTSQAKCALYSSGTKPYTLIAETEEKNISLTTSATWFWFSFSTRPYLIKDQTYYLAVLMNYTSGFNYYPYDTATATGGLWVSRTYSDGFPASISGGVSIDEQNCSIFCTYTATSSVSPTQNAPTVSMDNVQTNEWFQINTTINDGNGAGDFSNCTVELSNIKHVVLGWTASTNTFSIVQGPSYCQIDSASCSRTTVNSTAYTLTWQIAFVDQTSETGVDILADNTKVYDTSGNSGSSSTPDLFTYVSSGTSAPPGTSGGPAPSTSGGPGPSDTGTSVVPPPFYVPPVAIEPTPTNLMTIGVITLAALFITASFSKSLGRRAKLQKSWASFKSHTNRRVKYPKAKHKNPKWKKLEDIWD
jgi:hypothetical protein